MKFPKFKNIQYFLYQLLYFWRLVKFRDFQNSLRQAIADQKVDKVIMMSVIAKDIRKALRIDAKSEYIPTDHKNNEEVKMMIEVRHGKKMKFLNIRVTDDLKLI